MIISPPFLLTRNANETDEAWISRCMTGGEPGNGAFPLSHALQWHGGMHLREPAANASVRAIADGEVVYRRAPERQPSGPLPPDHAQAYRGGWTDNGVVVLRHRTEIGDGANADVTFFSIYVHLSEIPSAITLNGTVHRKDVLGRAGQIYGSAERQIHFEIVSDDPNLERLVGRKDGDLESGKSGRTDAIYGEVYFKLPADALVYPNRPALNSAAGVNGAAIGREVFVGLRYARGDGPVADRGDAYLSTYYPDGSLEGDALSESEAEYNIYASASAISKTYPASARPAASAIYELLRIGRIIGPDALNPKDVPHWRQVRHSNGTGWVNLNAANVVKFSDSDFPQWKGWKLIDDSLDQDSRCDSRLIKGWLDTDGDGVVTPAEFMARMAQSAVANKLARAICKFSTEWNSTTFDKRLGWLKEPSVENPNPLGMV